MTCRPAGRHARRRHKGRGARIRAARKRGLRQAVGHRSLTSSFATESQRRSPVRCGLIRSQLCGFNSETPQMRTTGAVGPSEVVALIRSRSDRGWPDRSFDQQTRSQPRNRKTPPLITSRVGLPRAAAHFPLAGGRSAASPIRLPGYVSVRTPPSNSERRFVAGRAGRALSSRSARATTPVLRPVERCLPGTVPGPARSHRPRPPRVRTVATAVALRPADPCFPSGGGLDARHAGS
jgi:hypothetical protein